MLHTAVYVISDHHVQPCTSMWYTLDSVLTVQVLQYTTFPYISVKGTVTATHTKYRAYYCYPHPGRQYLIYYSVLLFTSVVLASTT